MEKLVECHSSHTYAEQPLAVHWQQQRWEITEIEYSWRSPEGKHFRVRTKGDQSFELLYALSDDRWCISPR